MGANDHWSERQWRMNEIPCIRKAQDHQIVERSHLPARKTLEHLGIIPRTFYHWYDRYLKGGPEALVDKPSRPRRVWNRIPQKVPPVRKLLSARRSGSAG